MRAHYLQHVPFEGPGSIESWLRTAGYAITHTRLFESAELPDRDAFDLLVVMGGPMAGTGKTVHPQFDRGRQIGSGYLPRCATHCEFAGRTGVSKSP